MCPARDDAGSFPVVLLAGGFGTRLAERTDQVPKPMVEVGGKPILWHIMKIFGHYGCDDFLVAAGYRAEVIKRFFLDYRQQVSDLVIDFASGRVEHLTRPLEPWRVAIIDTGAETMTGGRLKTLAEHIDGRPFLMTYGDGVADVSIDELVAFHRGHGRLATFTAVRPPALFGRPQLEGDRVVAFAEKDEADAGWINGGFFVLEPEVLDWIDGPETIFESDTLPRLAEADQLRAHRHTGFWHPMDTLRDVRTLDEMSRSATAPWELWT
ncbi:MAG: glucose-1-phosphate cytidylyltransferase [Phycisphaerales bacterium]|nr:glucose-1-phosphate cytidylyltransferase [Phycisphaerae bacterium]NNF44443.1 glucose-1-phosphate cytidylyltransferase [Phycisphaerales bacterium]NNM26218.1 glucose-1-phosphate cytidylyltransferase [Phycisphaerales bacterium]